MKSSKNRKLYEHIAELNEQLKEAKNENLILKQSQKDLEELKQSLQKTKKEYEAVTSKYLALIDEVKSLKAQYVKSNKELLKKLSNN